MPISIGRFFLFCKISSNNFLIHHENDIKIVILKMIIIVIYSSVQCQCRLESPFGCTCSVELMVLGMGREIYVGDLGRCFPVVRVMSDMAGVPLLHYSYLRIWESLCWPSWCCKNHGIRILVGWSSRVLTFVGVLHYPLTFCVLNESVCYSSLIYSTDWNVGGGGWSNIADSHCFATMKAEVSL